METYGDATPATARAYYEYGNALLTKEEESSAQGVLGNIDKRDGDNEFDEVGEEEEEEKRENQEEGDEGDAEGEGEEEEEDAEGGDIQIAWETLDVSSRAAHRKRLL